MTGSDPGQHYQTLTEKYGAPAYTRIDVPATPEQRLKLATFDAATLAGDPVESILTHAPANNAPIGGLKVITKNGWFAARPSGTENIFKIYAESFVGLEHLNEILAQVR